VTCKNVILHLRLILHVLLLILLSGCCADSVCVRSAAKLGRRRAIGAVSLVAAAVSTDPGVRERTQGAGNRRIRSRAISRVVSPARDASVLTAQPPQTTVSLAQGTFTV